MHVRVTPIIVFSLLAVAASAAHAEQAADPKARYTMTPVDGGFMRLDSETGAVALCIKKNADWSCEPVKDGTQNTTDRTTALEAENKALKDRITALENGTGTSAKPPSANDYPTEPPGGSVSQLPTEEEVDKAFDYIEGMYKKLRDRIKKFETPSDTTPGTKPDVAPGDGRSGAL